MRWVSTLFALLALASCQNDPLKSFCSGATVDSYSPTFKVWCPAQQNDYFVPIRYGCPPEGEGISPPISWSGIPEGTTHLRVIVEDATCGYECNSCCKYDHWVLDIPLSDMGTTALISQDGIPEGAAHDPAMLKYTLPNSSDKKAYMPFCPPKIQTHAYIFRLIAYKNESGKITVTGRSQSMPLLYSLLPH